MQLYTVRPDVHPLPVLWPHIEHYVDQVCKNSHGEMTPDTLRAHIHNGDVQLWVVIDETQQGPERFRAIVGTQLGEAISGMKTCTIIFCAGKGRKDWLHLLDRLAQWARSEGCMKLRGLMRRGWAKDLQQFKLIANMMEMELL